MISNLVICSKLTEKKTAYIYMLFLFDDPSMHTGKTLNTKKKFLFVVKNSDKNQG